VNAELELTVFGRSLGGEMKEIGTIRLVQGAYRYTPNNRHNHGEETLSLLVGALEGLNS
jgi:hypothetical protein